MTDVNKKQVGHMLHALGIAYPRSELLLPGKRYRPLPVAYRNYYQDSFCKEWQDLVDKGMAGEGNVIGLHYYYVTKKGISHLRDIGYLFEDEK